MSIAEPRDGFINLNGVRHHYLDSGGDGNPIVILHATGFSAGSIVCSPKRCARSGIRTRSISAAMATVTWRRT